MITENNFTSSYSIDPTNNCLFHPSPQPVMLPSGLIRDRMEAPNESPMLADH